MLFSLIFRQPNHLEGLKLLSVSFFSVCINKRKLSTRRPKSRMESIFALTLRAREMSTAITTNEIQHQHRNKNDQEWVSWIKTVFFCKCTWHSAHCTCNLIWCVFLARRIFRISLHPLLNSSLSNICATEKEKEVARARVSVQHADKRIRTMSKEASQPTRNQRQWWRLRAHIWQRNNE